MILKNIKNQKAGYTIIETMIAISLFVVIVMMGMGTLLNANLLHQKSRDMRSIIDSLSFTLDDMSKNLRTGKDYHCIDDGDKFKTNPHSCSRGDGVSFKESVSGQQWVYYFGINDKNGTGIFKSTAGGNNPIQLTPGDIDIDETKSGFFISGAEPPPGDSNQPYVTIKLKGTITYKGVQSPFDVETSVSQRLIDIGE